MMNIEFLELPEIYCKEKDFWLVPFRIRHAESLTKALSSPKIAHQVSNIPRNYTMKDARAWIDTRSSIITEKSERVDFVIVRKTDDDEVVMGSVGFIEMNKSLAKRHLAQASMWVASEFEGQGIATSALEVLIDYGFSVMGIHKVHGYAHPENIGSIKVMQKVGMKHEATIVDDWIRDIDGEEFLADSYICSIINPQSRIKRLAPDYRSRYDTH